MRERALRIAFGLLCGPLARLHEVAGWTLFGAAWDGRRSALLADVRSGPILDLGCGAGRLVARCHAGGLLACGIDPSPAMLRLAARRGAPALRADARRLPFLDGSIAHVVSTYPGPWILDTKVWEEARRVLQPGGRVIVLLGGTYERGPGARVRRSLARAGYGRAASDSDAGMPKLPTVAGLRGQLSSCEDRWGRVWVWTGTRDPSVGGV